MSAACGSRSAPVSCALALMTEMGKAVQFTIEQQGWKAGKYTIGYQACDD